MFEKLYRLTQKDVESYSLVDPYYNVKTTLTGAGGPNSWLSTINLDTIGDRFLVLRSAAMEVVGGGVDFPYKARIYIATPSSESMPAQFDIAFRQAPVVLVQDNNAQFSGELLVPSKWNIVAEGIPVSVLTGGSVRLSVSGFLVPRGSIRRL